MKTRYFSIGCAVVAAVWPATRGEAAPHSANRYDLLGQVLEPLTAVFMPEHAGKAFAATLVLDEATGLPKEWHGQEAKLVFQPPAMAKLSATVGGEPWALCRVKQELWGVPGEKWVALEKFFPSSKPRKKSGREPGLPDFALPFSPQQLIFLPVLFQVEDEGVSPTGARLLTMRLTPPIAEGLQAEAGKIGGENLADWAARIAVREVQGKRPQLERIEVFRPGWRFAADVRRWALVREVPASYWLPDPGTSSNSGTVFRFKGGDARRWWNGAWKQWFGGR